MPVAGLIMLLLCRFGLSRFWAFQTTPDNFFLETKSRDQYPGNNSTPNRPRTYPEILGYLEPNKKPRITPIFGSELPKDLIPFWGDLPRFIYSD